MSWSRKFDDPIPLPNGRKLVSLKDAADHITKLSKREQRRDEWQTAVRCLIEAAEDRGPILHARIGMLRALKAR